MEMGKSGMTSSSLSENTNINGGLFATRLPRALTACGSFETSPVGFLPVAAAEKLCVGLIIRQISTRQINHEVGVGWARRCGWVVLPGLRFLSRRPLRRLVWAFRYIIVWLDRGRDGISEVFVPQCLAHTGGDSQMEK